MTATLYKNTQTEGDHVYKDLWQLSPYDPPTLFSSGFTSERAEYVIPDGYEITKQNGKDCLTRAGILHEPYTNPDGRPGIRIMGGSPVCKELLRPGEEPREEPEPERRSGAWVPQMVNGEWEIY